MGIGSSYRFAVTQHQCTAARFRAECSPHCSVLLCKTGSQQAVCHCIYTYGDLLFIQVCRDPAPMHCSKVQGKMQSSLFSAALQNRITAGSVSLRFHLCRFALQTSAQRPSNKAMQHCSGQNAVSTVQCCSAKQAHSRQCVTALLLCKTGSQQAVCHCAHAFADLLFIQVCSDPAPMHCSKVQGQMLSPLFSAALQNSLTAGSVSLHLHLWGLAPHSDPASMHCSKVQGRMLNPTVTAYSGSLEIKSCAQQGQDNANIEGGDHPKSQLT